MITMRIAIISYDALPDARIEKYINSIKTIYPDTDVYFIGSARKDSLALISPEVFKHVPLSRRLRSYMRYPVLNRIAARKISRIIRNINPDLLIGINIEGGSVASIISKKLKIPLLIDHHEIWAIQLKWVKETGYRLIKHIFKKKYWIKLEEELLGNNVATVTSDPIREYFKEKTGNTSLYVVKNYPSIIEIPKQIIPLECNKILFANIGTDLLKKDVRIYRDAHLALPFIEKVYMEKPAFEILVLGWKGTYKNFIKGIGWIRHFEMYKYLTKCHYGLFVSQPSEPHHYNNPNRPYVYAAAGCIPIITGDWATVLEDLRGYAIEVDPDSYPTSIYKAIDDSLSIDCNTLNELRFKINRHILENLYWEKQNNIIRTSIDKSLSYKQ